MPYLCFDVSFLKENIVAAIPLQQSETRSCHRECGPASRSKGPAQGLLCNSGIVQRVCNQAAININISLMWVITLQRLQRAPHRAFAALWLTVSVLCVQARQVERRSLSSLFLHFHSKYTDHCARLRKQGLCILAGGIYSERATDLLYLVFDGWGSEGEPGVRVCKIQKREVEKPRAGCQRWYWSPNNCSGFQKWQKQSCLKPIQMFQEFARWNPASWTLRRSRLPKMSVICHQGACSSSQ